MKENETSGHPYPFPTEESRRSEEVNPVLEKSDQRRPDRNMPCLPRNEQIRLVVLSLALFALLVSFLPVFFSGAILPLFGTMVVVFLGYRRFDAWLDRPH
jgi:hypothetical protein